MAYGLTNAKGASGNGISFRTYNEYASYGTKNINTIKGVKKIEVNEVWVDFNPSSATNYEARITWYTTDGEFHFKDLPFYVEGSDTYTEKWTETIENVNPKQNVVITLRKASDDCAINGTFVFY